MVYFANLFVNPRDRLCDVARHVSAQSLDFLDIDEISSFLNWKHPWVPILKEMTSWMDTILAVVFYRLPDSSGVFKYCLQIQGAQLSILNEDPSCHDYISHIGTIHRIDHVGSRII